jgi:hypothetical protein
VVWVSGCQRPKKHAAGLPSGARDGTPSGEATSTAARAAPAPAIRVISDWWQDRL